MIASPNPASTKADLRTAAIARRDSIPQAERRRCSLLIAERAIAIAEKANPRVLAAYMPIRTEVDPTAVMTWAHSRQIPVALPSVIDATTIVFRTHERDGRLETGRFGTRAPAGHAAQSDPDLVMVPMIAFDRRGARLGYGRGFYDRAMAALRQRGVTPILVGLAFRVQEVEAIPAEGHDIHMDWILTEDETLHINSN